MLWLWDYSGTLEQPTSLRGSTAHQEGSLFQEQACHCKPHVLILPIWYLFL